MVTERDVDLFGGSAKMVPVNSSAEGLVLEFLHDRLQG